MTALPIHAKARLLHRDHVVAGRQTDKMVFAAIVRSCGVPNHRRLVFGLNRRAWDGPAGRVANHTEKLGPAPLRGRK